MKYALFFIVCLIGFSKGVMADVQVSNPYVGALGFEVFSGRIQRVHMWRRTQEIMQEVALTNEVLLRLGWSGMPEAGNNWSTRLAVKTEGRPDMNLLLDGDVAAYDEGYKTLSLDEVKKLTFDPNQQMLTADIIQGQGVCYDVHKGNCFEEDSREINPIFGDFYGSGGRFDEELQTLLENGELKNFAGGDLDKAKEVSYTLEPFSPLSAQFYQTNSDNRTLGDWQQDIKDKLQIKSLGETDAHIVGLNESRVGYKRNVGLEGVSTILKNVLNLSQVDVSQTIFKKMLNTAFGIRGLIQLNTHMALYQKNLIDALVANQALGSLRVTGSSLAAKTSSTENESDEEDYSGLNAYWKELKEDPMGKLWGAVKGKDN